jgi:hypothetical protein
MITIRIDTDMVDEATVLAAEIPVLRNSIRSGEGTMYGVLGELMFIRACGGERQNTYDYDVVMDNDHTVDVKTKCVTSEPRPHYDCSVAAIASAQDCDYYAFIRVLNDLSQGWYLGSLTKEEFYNKARYMEAGKCDDSGWSPIIDCYSVMISELT